MSRLIDADALIEKMKDCGFSTAQELMANAFCFAALKSESLAPTIGDWISVKDRLPEDDVWVLVWEKQGFAYGDKLVSGVWQIGANNGAIITHWMPLPKGPKEGAEE